MLIVRVFLTGASLATETGTSAAAPGRIQLTLPLACDFGRTCFIQSYVDMKDGPGARDHRCGAATYDGHKGVDFRILSAKATEDGVPVLASASGIVKGHRDGMADRLLTAKNRSLVAGRECGNGVVLDHGNGWETQYCHLKRGSVVVRPGQRVTRGQRLGSVGYSGAAQFAHVHLSVRHDGHVIDPFTGGSPGNAPVCRAPRTAPAADAEQAGSLWASVVRSLLSYRTAVLIEAGFAGAAVRKEDLEGARSYPPAAPDSAALVFFGRAVNLKAGDRLAVTLRGPGGFRATNPGRTVGRSKATWMSFAGKRRRAQRWPAGEYTGVAAVFRNGRVVSRKTSVLEID